MSCPHTDTGSVPAAGAMMCRYDAWASGRGPAPDSTTYTGTGLTSGGRSSYPGWYGWRACSCISRW
jgi:hypothetical protein